MKLAAVFLAASLPFSPAAASAAAHSLAVSVFNGDIPYGHTLVVRDGGRAEFSGMVNSRQLAFSGGLTPYGRGLYRLEYEVELSSGPGGRTRSFQARSSLSLMRGSRITAVACGPWRVRFELDAGRGAGGRKDTPWSLRSSGNYHLTAKALSGDYPEDCRLVLRADGQYSVSDSLNEGGKSYAFTFGGVLSYGPGGVLTLQYQAENALDRDAAPLSAGGAERLGLGRPLTVKAREGDISGLSMRFLLLGRPGIFAGGGRTPEKPAGQRPVKKKAEEKYGTVELLQ